MNAVRVWVRVEDAYGQRREAEVREDPAAWRQPGGAPDPDAALLIALERAAGQLLAWRPTLPQEPVEPDRAGDRGAPDAPGTVGRSGELS
jgi:hypothetical protein